jgi:phosphoribosylglycinamide formyltransferase-1
VINHRDYKTREDFDRELVKLLEPYDIDLVCLAGFMRILTPTFLRKYQKRVINIHPAILPSFAGSSGQKDAFEYGVKFSGCTIHFVDEGVDTGPIIIQAVVPVMQGDTTETLKDRILAQEHKIYPQAIQYFAEGRVEVKGKKVVIKKLETEEDFAHINPLAEIFDK